MTALLPCPLCGGTTSIETYNDFNYDLNFQDVGGHIACQGCELRLCSPLSGHLAGVTKEMTDDQRNDLWQGDEAYHWLIKHWNTRPRPKAVRLPERLTAPLVHDPRDELPEDDVLEYYDPAAVLAALRAADVPVEGS